MIDEVCTHVREKGVFLFKCSVIVPAACQHALSDLVIDLQGYLKEQKVM